MKLHFAPRTRAVRVRWLLEELELPYSLERVQPPAPVPVLMDGDTVLKESLAMYLYLADRVPERQLAPAVNAPERAEFLEWLVFAEATLERAVETNDASTPALLARVETRLQGREHIAGNAFSVADIVLASVLHRAHHSKLLEERETLVKYVLRETGRPGSRRAVAL